MVEGGGGRREGEWLFLAEWGECVCWVLVMYVRVWVISC